MFTIQCHLVLATVHAPVPCSHCCYNPKHQAWRHGSSHHIQNVFASEGISGTWSDTPQTNLKFKRKDKNVSYILPKNGTIKKVKYIFKNMFVYLQCCCVDALCQMIQVFQKPLFMSALCTPGLNRSLLLWLVSSRGSWPVVSVDNMVYY